MTLLYKYFQGPFYNNYAHPERHSSTSLSLHAAIILHNTATDSLP